MILTFFPRLFPRERACRKVLACSRASITDDDHCVPKSNTSSCNSQEVSTNAREIRRATNQGFLHRITSLYQSPPPRGRDFLWARSFFFFHRFDPPCFLLLLLRLVRSKRYSLALSHSPSNETKSRWSIRRKRSEWRTCRSTDLWTAGCSPSWRTRGNRGSCQESFNRRANDNRDLGPLVIPLDSCRALRLRRRVDARTLAGPRRRRRGQHRRAAPAPCAASYPTGLTPFSAIRRPPGSAALPSSPRGTPRERVFHLLHGVLHELLIGDPSVSQTNKMGCLVIPMRSPWKEIKEGGSIWG